MPVVLGIGPTDSAAAELLASTGTGVMVDWSADSSEFIRTCHSEPAQQVKESVVEYSRQALAARMAELLISIAN